MKKLIFVSLIALVAVFIATEAFADNIYKDDYTYETTAGSWYFTDINSTTHHSAGMKTDVVFIDDSGETTSCVTAARTGYTFIVSPAALQGIGGNGWMLTLPATSNGLTYRFVSATGTALSVRPLSKHSKIQYGKKLSLDTGDAITSVENDTPTSLTVVSQGSVWYVVDGSDNWKDGGAI